MDYAHMTAPCGIDCFNCPVFHAKDNEKLRKIIAEKFHIPLEEAYCGGCRNVKGKVAFLGMTQPCSVFRCISEKEISFCHECDEFPCDHLHPYADKADDVPHNTKVFNLCLMKKMGVEAWARNKAGQVRKTYFESPWKL